MSIAVLIVNWNSKNYLRKCLHSLVEGNREDFRQVVVVDAGSRDGCEELLRVEYPWVDFLQLEENVGFAAANNLGFEKVKEDKLLLLNPDTWVFPGAISALSEAINQLPKAGIVAPRIFNADGSIQQSCVQSFPTPLNQALDANILRKIFANLSFWGSNIAFRSDEPTPVQVVSGACMMMRSETYRDLRGFREEYFMYAEDVDLCFRVQKVGLNVYHVPKAKVIHFGGGSSAKKGGQFGIVMMRVTMEKFMYLNYGPNAANSYRLLQGLSAILRIGLLFSSITVLKGKKRIHAEASLKKWLAVLKWVLGKENRIKYQ